MNFKASRASAVEKLENFVENNLVDYSKQRNFDYDVVLVDLWSPGLLLASECLNHVS